MKPYPVVGAGHGNRGGVQSGLMTAPDVIPVNYLTRRSHLYMRDRIFGQVIPYRRVRMGE